MLKTKQKTFTVRMLTTRTHPDDGGPIIVGQTICKNVPNFIDMWANDPKFYWESSYDPGFYIGSPFECSLVNHLWKNVFNEKIGVVKDVKITIKS